MPENCTDVAAVLWFYNTREEPKLEQIGTSNSDGENSLLHLLFRVLSFSVRIETRLMSRWQTCCNFTVLLVSHVNPDINQKKKTKSSLLKPTQSSRVYLWENICACDLNAVTTWTNMSWCFWDYNRFHIVSWGVGRDGRAQQRPLNKQPLNSPSLRRAFSCWKKSFEQTNKQKKKQKQPHWDLLIY